MIKHLRLLFLLPIIFCFATSIVNAQTSFASEDELKKQAQKLFEEEEFEEAYPLYTQLTSLYPKDADYNYKLGVCMVFGSDDKEKPIPFLEFAVKNPDIEKEAYFYLAKAYHLNYRFDDAITMYVKYKSVAKAAKVKSLDVDRHIDMCKNGRKLLKNVTDLVVLEKKEMNKAEFFRSYDVSTIGGKLLVKPDDPSFKTKLDTKKKEKSIIYLAADNSQVYFSSFGETDANGKDIYISRKLPTGEWSKPQTLGYPINTAADEDYPFLHPNGKVLYFSSKGHNSMGGYDIFKSTYDAKSNTWGTPVNMDFPINTPDDDILYITDIDEKEAYFSSARTSVAGKTSVYHIDVNRKPVNASIIAGSVKRGVDSQPLALKIAVKNVTDNTIVGIFNSSASDGSYKIDLPNGGKFLFTVEAEGMPTQSEAVVLPVQYELKPLQQEITYDAKTSKLIIKNMFDAAPSESSYLYALNYIKEKSKMDVTAANEINKANDLAKAASKEKADSIANYKPVEAKVDNSITNNEVIQMAYKDAQEDENEVRVLEEQIVLAKDIAADKAKLADIKAKEGNKAEAEQLNKETTVALNLIKKLEQNVLDKKKEAELSKKYAEDLEAAIKLDDSAVALEKLKSQKEELEAISEKNNESVDIELVYKNELENKKKEVDEVKQVSVDLKQEIADNETLISGYETDIANTSKKSVKEGLENQVAVLKQENIEKQKAIEENEQKVITVQKEYEGMKNEADIAVSVFSNSSTNNELAKNNTLNNNSTSSDINTSTESKEPLKSPEMLSSVDSKYNLEVDKINNSALSESEKEKKKADLLNDWAAAIEKEVVAKKQEYITSTDETKKEKLSSDILLAEKIAKQKRSESETSSNKSLELAKNENVVTAKNTTESNSSENTASVENNSAEVYNAKFSEELKSTENTENLLDKEAKKYQIYTNWTRTITNDIANKKKVLNETSDPQERTKLNSEIAQLQSDLDDKESIAEAVLTNVESLRAQNNLANNNVTNTSPNTSTNNEVKTNSTSTENKQDSTKVTSSNTIANNNTTTAINDSVNKVKELSSSSTVNSSAISNELVSDNEIKKDTSIASSVNTSNEASNTSSINTSIDKTNNANVTESPNLVATKNIAAEEIKTKRDGAAVAYKEANDFLNLSNELKAKASEVKKAEERDALFAEAESLTIEAEKKQNEAAMMEAEANRAEYNQNLNNIQIIRQTNLDQDADDVMIAGLLVDESKTYFAKAQELRENAKKSNDFFTKNSALIEAKENEQLAIEKQTKAFETYKKYNPNYVFIANTSEPVVVASNASTLAKNNQPVDNNNSNAQTNNVSSEINANANNPIESNVNNNEISSTENKIPLSNNTTINSNEYTPNNNTQPISAIIQLAPDEKFERKSSPVYSDASPIPINEPLPEGLVYKVQIGAFRNAIPQDLFQGITPITGEVTPSGLTRYTAGLFKKFASANQVKGTIKSLGYKDAFVVAFYNGKRISITEAANISGESIDVANNNSSTSSNNANSSAATNISNTINNSTTNNNTTSNSAIAKSEKVESVPGLFYTIQVGVYSQPITPDKIFNIQPLYTETTSNGYLRYTTGMYNNVNRAVEAKNVVVNIGVSDAFVVAYNKGKRVTMAEALQFETQDPNILAKSPNINMLPSYSVNSTNSIVQSPIINSNTVTNNNTANVVFKVQIGAYKEEVPLEVVNKFITISNKGIDNYKDSNGVTIYTLGNFKTYEEALSLKKEVVNASIEGAFVVAYNNGNKISVEEAKKLIK